LNTIVVPRLWIIFNLKEKISSYKYPTNSSFINLFNKPETDVTLGSLFDSWIVIPLLLLCSYVAGFDFLKEFWIRKI